jgi:hypothetical protein
MSAARRTGTPFGFRRLPEVVAAAERREPRAQRPLGLLLLPTRLEAFALQAHAEDLLSAPGVAAVEPARLAAVPLPGMLVDALGGVQARRLRLPGTPRAIVVYDPAEYPLARALISRHVDAQLWYRRWPGPGDVSPSRRERLEELDDHCAFRADHVFEVDPDAPDPHAANAALWERLERLGIESGRLGSERPDVMRRAARR